jgi:signal transduction histidine kinase/DNA-binding response OmpR family regulator/ligand-binding sensor domain-containing protein
MNKAITVFILACTLLAASFSAASYEVPNHSFHKLNIPQLSGTSFYKLYQDRKGYVWIATRSGLYRFDGYDLKKVSHDLDSNNSLTETEIVSMFEDNSDNLWVAGNHGLHRFIPAKSLFKKYQHDPNDPGSIPKGTVFTHMVDSNDRVWISSSEGLALYQPEDDSFKRVIPFTRTLEEAGSLAEKKRLLVMGMHELSRDKFLLVTYSNGVYIYNHETKEVTQSPLVNDGREYKKFRSSFKLNDESYLLSTLSGIFEFDLSNWTITPFYPDSIKAEIVSQGYPAVFQKTGPNEFYIADGKLHFYNGQKLATYFTASDFDIKDLSENMLVSHVLKTQDNGLLIAVNGVGLYTSHESLSTAPLVTDLHHPRKVSKSNPKVISQDKMQRIWVSDGSLVNVFRETEYASRVDIVASLPLKNIHSFILTDQSQYFAANSAAIYKINKDFSAKEIFSVEKKGVSGITKVDWLSENTLLVSLERGIYLLDLISGELNQLNAPEFDLLNLAHYTNKEISISPDRSKLFISLWRDGYLVYDLINNRVTQAHREVDNDYPIPKVEMTLKSNESNGKLWILLKENQYALFDWSIGTMKLMSTNLAPLACVTGSEDNHYVQQNGGQLVKVNNGDTLRIGEASGIMPGMLNGDTCFLSASNRLYLGSSKGLRVFIEPVENKVVPKVILTQFLIADKVQSLIDNPLVTANAGEIESVNIPYDINIFSFRFSSSSNAHSGVNKYRYRLKGVDDQWRYTSSANRAATYTNLDAGEYDFVLESSNNSGLFSKQKLVKIHVSGSPFFSWWAITLYVVFVVGCVIVWVTMLKITVHRQTGQIAKDALDLDDKNKELVTLTAKIQKLLKVKDSLFKHISHEFKTPLTVLLGYTDEIETAFGESHQESVGKKTGQLVVRQIKYIGRLTNQLTDLSRLEGVVDMQLQPLNLSQILNAIVPMFDGFAKQLKVALKTSIQDNLVIDAELESLERIISNLISNAIKYNHQCGTVEVSAHSNGDRVEIIIRDTGIGISSDDQKLIFKQFGKVDNRDTLDHHVESTGLGLAIVKEAVEANLGKIEVNSELGFGSEFAVSFPISHGSVIEPTRLESLSTNVDKSEIQKSEEKRKINNIEVVQSRKTVLIVEDIDDIAQLLVDLLENQYNVIRAEHGRRGLELAKIYLPDVIISDVMMPIMDGFEFAKAIHNDTNTAHIPLLFLTAMSSEDAQISGLNLGAVDFIQKPFNSEVISLKIKNIIDNSQRLSEKFAQISTVSNKEVRKKVSKDPKFTEKLDNYIEKNMEEKITVEGMASSLFMDRSAFTRKVKSISSLNAQQYILHYRLAKAYEFLPGAPSVAEVALQLGFSTQNHLSTAFSKQFGITCRDRMSGKEKLRQSVQKNSEVVEITAEESIAD